jgi:MFS family permease
MVTGGARGWVTLSVVGSAEGWLGVARRRMVGRMPRQRLALAVLLAASFTLAVDFSILNVALPVIGADVGLGLSHLQWIATSFALCAAGFTLLFGRIADLFGRRRLFLLGMALLGASSLVGGVADSPALLLAARAGQGLATAAVIPAALSLLTTTFTEGPLRERALGLNGALMAAGFTTGAVLGGLLTDVLSWRWAFFVNVVVAIVVLAVAPLVIAESRPDARPRLDITGSALVTLALLATVYGIVEAPLALVAAAVLVVAFLAVEARVVQPLVPLGILRRRTVAWGNLAGVLAFATETGLVFALTLYLQGVLDYSALATGAAFAVLGAGTVLGGMLGPRVIARVGARRALAGGLVVQALATLPLVALGDDGAWIVPLLVAMFAGGVANLVAIVGFMVLATSGLPDGEQGLATGLTSLSQQVGITLGIPVVSAVATSRADLLDGLALAIAVIGAVCVAAALVVLQAAQGRVDHGVGERVGERAVVEPALSER